MPEWMRRQPHPPPQIPEEWRGGLCDDAAILVDTTLRILERAAFINWGHLISVAIAEGPVRASQAQRPPSSARQARGLAMPIREQFQFEWQFEKALRDWFAGLAMQAIVSLGHPFTLNGEKTVADTGAYLIADAMLIRRKGATGG